MLAVQRSGPSIRAGAMALALLLGSTLGPGIRPAGAAETLNVAATDWPPFMFEDGGLFRDITEVCLTEAGWQTRFSRVSIEQIYDGLRSGLLDVHVMSRRADREAFVDFGREVLYADAYRPVVRAGSGIAIDAVEDFDGLRLGHLEGLRYSEEFLDYVNRRRLKGDLVVAGSNEELMRLLLGGSVDVFVNLGSTATSIARDLGARERVELLPFAVKENEYAFAVSTKSRRVADRPALLAAADRCVAAMKEDGRYARLLAEYGLE